MKTAKQISDDYMAALVAVVGFDNIAGLMLLMENAIKEGQQSVLDAVVQGQEELKTAYSGIQDKIKS